MQGVSHILLMGWFDWMFSALSYLGLYYKEARILFLGLDNAGKTTLLMVLKHNKIQAFSPTLHPNAEELVMGSICFHAHDLGGHEAARRLWKDYYTTVDAIVYLVDAVDRDRFPEARQELLLLLEDPSLLTVPILILGNKIDNHEAVSEQELKAELGHLQTTGKDQEARSRPIELFMCSVLRKMGYVEGFQWLAHHLEDR